MRKKIGKVIGFLLSVLIISTITTAAPSFAHRTGGAPGGRGPGGGTESDMSDSTGRDDELGDDLEGMLTLFGRRTTARGHRYVIRQTPY